jgi:hypothetical protein
VTILLAFSILLAKGARALASSSRQQSGEVTHVDGFANRCRINAWAAQRILRSKLQNQSVLAISKKVGGASFEAVVEEGFWPIDGNINAATVAENRPHYGFRVNSDMAWW